MWSDLETTLIHRFYKKRISSCKQVIILGIEKAWFVNSSICIQLSANVLYYSRLGTVAQVIRVGLNCSL